MFSLPRVTCILTALGCAFGAAGHSVAVEKYAALPLSFERAVASSTYVAHGDGYAVTLRPAGAELKLRRERGGTPATISLEFVGGNPKAALAAKELPGKVNYIIGNDPAKWRLDVPTYERVAYERMYPGIDVVFRGNQREIEFDLVLAPGAEVSVTRLRFGGARELRVDEDGTLRVVTPDGSLRLGVPGIYQEIDGARKTVQGRYKLLARNEAGFEVDAYDRSRPLVIDPTVFTRVSPTAPPGRPPARACRRR